VSTLIDLIEHPDRRNEPPAHATLPTQLVVRRSTAAPKAAS
jgi:hypothetical protein